MSKSDKQKKLANTEADIKAISSPQMEAEVGLPENPVAAQLYIDRFSVAAELKQMS